MANPKQQFTDFDIATIRLEYAKGILDKKAWADARLCSPETIARIARGDTYRHRGGQQQHHAWGGLEGAKSSRALPGGTPTQARTQARTPALATEGASPPFRPPPNLPTAASALPDEPDDAELAASFARLQAALAAPSAEEVQRTRANALVDELRSQAMPPLPSIDGAELG